MTRDLTRNRGPATRDSDGLGLDPSSHQQASVTNLRHRASDRHGPQDCQIDSVPATVTVSAGQEPGPGPAGRLRPLVPPRASPSPSQGTSGAVGAEQVLSEAAGGLFDDRKFMMEPVPILHVAQNLESAVPIPPTATNSSTQADCNEGAANMKRNENRDCSLSLEQGRGSEFQLCGDHERWTIVCRVLLFLTYSTAIALVGVGIWQIYDYRQLKYVVAWSVAALFSAFAVPLSLHAILMHILNYRNRLQRHYIRILWMVPMYSIQSWFALRFNDQKIYLKSTRELYEAYAIYNFYSLLRDYLGNDEKEREEKLNDPHRPYVHHLKMFFLCFTPLLPRWKRGRQFLRQTLQGVLQ